MLILFCKVLVFHHHHRAAVAVPSCLPMAAPCLYLDMRWGRAGGKGDDSAISYWISIGCLWVPLGFAWDSYKIPKVFLWVLLVYYVLCCWSVLSCFVIVVQSFRDLL